MKTSQPGDIQNGDGEEKEVTGSMVTGSVCFDVRDLEIAISFASEDCRLLAPVAVVYTNIDGKGFISLIPCGPEQPKNAPPNSCPACGSFDIRVVIGRSTGKSMPINTTGVQHIRCGKCSYEIEPLKEDDADTHDGSVR